ncbi:hypothetical protein BDB00DRAFT_791981 [Zychaea mexicana]|uniref:uncharacterized protein n=1 Tax=Zychaea mexicana TaxID=64656 RepID=UPI0022FECB31|nr:uncharacterized protein BDB00DRAFT_791981 [Zychaea mexicana]KAI9488342.1 hypothetical protein BDB00DRAFT_791981 [Zychaea mexicana]
MPRPKGQKKAAKKRIRTEIGNFVNTVQQIAASNPQNEGEEQVPVKNAFDLLKWKKNGDSHLRGTYNKLVPSRTQKWRVETTEAKKKEDAVNSHTPINSLFPVVEQQQASNDAPTRIDRARGDDDDDDDRYSIDYHDGDTLLCLIEALDEATLGLESATKEYEKDYIKRHYAVKMSGIQRSSKLFLP